MLIAILNNEREFSFPKPIGCSLKLKDFLDEDYNKASKVCCETSLYKQAGNSIVVDVIYSVLKELLS